SSPVHASVSFANCTATTWSMADGFALGSRGAPEDAWGTRTIVLPFDVPPETEVTIPVEGVAPARAGRYTFAWQLLRGGEWMSEPSPPATSTVLDAVDCGKTVVPARFLSQNAPGGLVLNQL